MALGAQSTNVIGLVIGTTEWALAESDWSWG